MSSFIISLAIRLTMLLIVGGGIAILMRRSAGAVRHLVIAVTLACALALPATMVLVPEWRIAVLPATRAPEAIVTTAPQIITTAPIGVAMSRPTIDRVPVASDRVRPSPPAVSTATRPWLAMAAPELGLALWLLGIAIGFAWLAAGRYGLARVRRRATPLDSDEWSAILRAERRRAGVARPVALLSSPAVSTPVAWGILSPVIVLPEAAHGWTNERRRVVVMHELAHIARRDSATQLVGALACIVYWFHPLVILTARRLRSECERACDERVLELGTPAADYAAHLLDVARLARSFGAASIVSVAMARPSQLEGRLLAVLRARPRRARSTRRSRVAATVLAACALVAVSAFRPVARVVHARTPERASPSPIRVAEAMSVRAHARPTIARPHATGVAAAMVKTRVGRPTPDSVFQQTVPVSAGGTLVLDLETGGDVTIVGSDEPSVSVTGSLGGRDWRETTVSLDGSSGAARLVSRYTGSSDTQSFDNSFTIRVPKRFNVRLSSAGGSVSISGVEGSFTGRTGGGEIAIDKANGEATLTTGGGDVRVSDSHLSGAVATGGGTVRFNNVTGGITGSSGSSRFRVNRFDLGWREGDTMPILIKIDTAMMARVRVEMERARATMELHRGTMDSARATIRSAMDSLRTTLKRNHMVLERADHLIMIDKDGGDVTLDDAPHGARVTTGGGAIIIKRSSGRVVAETGGGDIRIGPAAGGAMATTGSGNVTITMVGGEAHPVEVRSGTGRVELVLPMDANATLDLETAYTNNFGKRTRIMSDWPLAVTETQEWDSSHGTPRKYVRVRQDLGKGGALIRVRTVNGDIRIKRGG